MQITEITDDALKALGVKFEYMHNSPGHGGRIIDPGPFDGFNLRPSICTRTGFWYADIPDGQDEKLQEIFLGHFFRRNDGHPIISAGIAPIYKKQSNIFLPSTILSFVTGRLYSEQPPTMLFAGLLYCATGYKNIATIELPILKEKYAQDILSQCPKDFQEICNNWHHSEDWKDRINEINNRFGPIVISYCR